MSDETPQEQKLPATTPPKTAATLKAGARPMAIVPTDFDQVYRLSTVLVASMLVPKEFVVRQGKGWDAPIDEKASIARTSIALMHGLEIGLPPMQAVQKIAVINGRPAVWGDAVIGLVYASDKAEFVKEYFTGKPFEDDYTAVCETKRRGQPIITKQEFSVADAKRARLWDTREKVRKAKGGDSYEAPNDSPWYRFPKRMMQMRARIALRDAYADVLGGLSIAEEFIGGDDAVDVTPAAEQPAPRKAPAPPPAEAPAQVIEHEASKTNGAAVVDPLEIPPALRRAPPPPPPPEVDEVDEDEWLDGLSNAYSSCEDIDSLNEKLLRLADPLMEKVSDEAWEHAKQLYDSNHQRIIEQA